MKHNVLRSAVHNALDSLTSGCSFVFPLGSYDFPFWQLVWSLPGGAFEADLKTGRVLTQVPVKGLVAHMKLRKAIGIVAKELPDFLRRHNCNPAKVQEITVRFEANRLQRQRVRVTIVRSNGQESEDLFYGTQLRRARRLDHRGRIRKSS